MSLYIVGGTPAAYTTSQTSHTATEVTAEVHKSIPYGPDSQHRPGKRNPDNHDLSENDLQNLIPEIVSWADVDCWRSREANRKSQELPNSPITIAIQPGGLLGVLSIIPSHLRWRRGA